MAFENIVYDKAIDERRSAVERRPYQCAELHNDEAEIRRIEGLLDKVANRD